MANTVKVSKGDKPTYLKRSYVTMSLKGENIIVTRRGKGKFALTREGAAKAGRIMTDTDKKTAMATAKELAGSKKTVTFSARTVANNDEKADEGDE